MLLDIKLGSLLLLLGCWNHHCLVGTVDFKENSHLFTISVFPLFCILKLLILLICVFVVYEVVEDVARVRYFQILPRFEV